MSSLIDELLDTLDDIDDGSEISKMEKHLILASLGAGEIGDRYQITPENVKAWRRIRADYYEAVKHGNVELADTLRVYLTQETMSLIFRSFTSKNCSYLFSNIRQRWFSESPV